MCFGFERHRDGDHARLRYQPGQRDLVGRRIMRIRDGL